jgi:GntR family transcriptional regulator/MocR family aminotransferase
MLTYDFEKKGKEPLYEYLYKCIREDILSGKLKSKEKLPSKREMAKNHNISVITVENAYAQLIVEGYIYTEEKKGYFVSEISEQYIDYKKRNENSQKKNNIESKKKEKKKQWFVDFSSNHMVYDNFPFATWSKIMRQTLLDQENTFLTSPAATGVEELRNAIADYLLHFRGLQAKADNIIVGAGTEYLYSIIVQLLGKDSTIALEDPGYKKISKVYESNGVRCLHLPMDKSGIRTEQLVNNNGYIIEDDYDSEFRFSGRPIPPMAGMDSSRVIYMNTFSKTLAPSIRIAYMILPDELIEKYNKELNFYSGTVSGFEQYTLANFISKGYYERHINRMRNYYREYRNRIIGAIKQSPVYSKVTIEEENAGLHFILGINKDIDDEKFKELLKQQNINISGVSDYCYNKLKEFEHKFIINYSAVPESRLVKALEIIDNILK